MRSGSSRQVELEIGVGRLADQDLGQSFDLRLLLSYYTGSTASFVAGLVGARFIFGRAWEDSVVIGFTCLFANSLLLGLAITEEIGDGYLAADHLENTRVMKRSEYTQQVAGEGYDAIAVAMSRALAELSREIAAAIRQEAAAGQRT